MKDKYGNTKRRAILFTLMAVICIIASLAVFLTISSVIKITDLPNIIYRFISGETLTAPEKIICYMRMPAMLSAVISGIALAIAGSVMQSITHNDLVSPFTLGVSSAAAFGASICIVFGDAWLHGMFGTVLGAFVAAGACAILVYSSSIGFGMSSSRLVLIGISMNYLFSAMSATVQFLADEYKLGEIIQWSFGSFNRTTWETLAISVVIVLFSSAVFAWLNLYLDVIANNDDEMTISLGVHPERLRVIIGGIAILLTATIISFTGVIGFVGLIAPHMARLVVGNTHRVFLPMAAVIGALLMLYSEVIGKYVLYPVTVPVGIIISFVGVPLFVHLVHSSRRK